MLAKLLYYSELFFGAVIVRVRVVLGGVGGAGCASTESRCICTIKAVQLGNVASVSAIF
jgi:hypothetical protein